MRAMTTRVSSSRVMMRRCFFLWKGRGRIMAFSFPPLCSPFRQDRSERLFRAPCGGDRPPPGPRDRSPSALSSDGAQVLDDEAGSVELVERATGPSVEEGPQQLAPAGVGISIRVTMH